MKRLGMIGLGSFVLIVLMTAIGCGDGGGGGGGAAAQQYTLNVEGTLSVTSLNLGATSLKLDAPQPQVMIGTALVEVTQNTTEELGIKFLDLDVRPQDPVDPELRIVLNPNILSTGIIFKLCEMGQPLGLSTLTLDLAVSSPSDIQFVVTPETSLIDDGQLLALGQLQAVADETDRSRIPILSSIPVINFLFQEQQHQAQIESLIIVLTPQILSDTE